MQLQQVINSKDDDANSFEKLIDSVTEELMFNELGSIYKSSRRFLNKLPHQLVSDWIDSVGNTDTFQSRIAYKRYESLKLLFEKFIGKKLTWEIKNVNKNVTDNGVESLQQGIWKINDRVFDYSEFSDGEKTLFAYVIMFFLMSQNKSASLKDSILIIDEPELHLHPDAEIELLNGMKDLVGDNGQLFIATHSLNILSHLEYEEVFVVKDGVISHPTTTNQRNALIELLSLEERIDKLSEFLTSISDWTFIHFMIECFSNPDVIEIANENDPQVKAFKEIIKSLYQNEDKKTLLLDFGAGKGRLFEQAMKDNLFKNLVDYTALEIMDNYHRDLKDKGIKKIYNSYLELEPESLDFVVLCNVLHEIPIQEWRENLNKIIESLKENGFLLIMEAKYLKKGEKIGNSGFILLNHEQINHLFNVNDSIHISENQSNITNVLLSKKSMKEISKETILDTLKLVEDDALNSIIYLRKSNKDEDSRSNNNFGRLSAFYSQLHINAKIAYSELLLNKTVLFNPNMLRNNEFK